MYGVNGEDGLGHVKPSLVLVEGVVLDELRHHVATGNILHDEVEVAGVLEAVVQPHDPRVVLVVVVVVRQHVPL